MWAFLFGGFMTTVSDDVKSEDVAEETTLFNLNLKDEEIIRMLKKPIEKSEQVWESRYGLSKVRDTNRKLWLGDHLDKSALYDHNVPYVDNRIFVSVETVVATVNARIPQPEVFPANDTKTSKQLAQDVEKGCEAHSEKHFLNNKFKYATRNLLTDRIGWVKLRWDESFGAKGDIIPEVIPPENIIVDHTAKPGDNPKFISEKLENTVEELIIKFPDSEDDLLKSLGITRGVRTQLDKLVNYNETWFSYYEDGKLKEGLAWHFRNVVLGKVENPNWNYKKNKEREANFLDSPPKPYVPMNFLNTGRYFIDETTLIEQAKPLQDVLNKRGRQIVENADDVGGGWIISTKAMTADAAEELTGARDEKIMVKTEDVRSAVNRMPVAAFPNYVIEDKFDARSEIDNVFSTHDISRGERSKNITLGQDQMQQQADFGRQDEIVRAIETTADRYFKLLVQLMKVFYTDEHWFRIVGEDGKFDSVMMKSDNIEDGIDLKVKSGSTMPLNKEGMKAMAVKMAELNLIDPLTFFEDAELSNPTKRMERLFKWQVDPASMVEGLNMENFDRTAFMDIQIILAGAIAKPRDEVMPEHLDYHNKFLMTGEFRTQKDEIKQNMVNHITLETEEMRRTLQLEETQMPTPEEIQKGNEQTDQNNAQDPQIDPATGQPIQGGAQGQPQGQPPQTPQGAPKPPAPPMPQMGGQPKPPMVK